ncbi:MAG: hypothetical protein M3Y27_23500 [Acidobacteriota bacterium]|nr:hypothetical protein [Acidobacteriota bacterium]
MNRIVVMRLVLFLLSVSAFADSLTLKDGRVLSGTYLGGSTTAVRFLVGDRVETYPIAAVDRIGFGDPGPAPAPAGSGLDSPPHDTRTANDTTALTTSDAAEKQQRFCDVLQSYRESVMRYTNETNAIRRAAMRKPDPFDWEDRITALMGTSGRFDNWHGTVRFHVEGQWVAVSFFPECKGFGQAIEFSTAQHYRLGLKENETLIPLNSPVARALGKLNANQAVTASGHLFHLSAGSHLLVKSDLRQRYRSTPDGLPASVASPRYLAAFDRIEVQ